MSTLTYNGITIGLTKTLGISHVPVRDVDESYLCTKVTLDVAGMVNGPPSQSQNASDLSGVNGTIGAGPISDTMRAIRHALEQERGLLIYDVGDSPTPMIVSPGVDGNGNLYPCDAANGPIPGPIVITRVDGIKTFLVRFQIVTFLIECPGSINGPPSALISNRYSQSHSIDSNFYTVVTTSGQATFRTDVLEAAKQVADDYRDILFPPCPRGFKRMAINIVATPARNALTYQVVDQERSFDMGETGPAGTNSNITDVSADYSVSSTGQAGAPVSLLTAHSVRVTVMGSKASSTWTLVKAAFTIAQSKLPMLDPTRGFLSQIMVNVGLTERKASLQATMLLNPNAVNAIPGIDVSGLMIDTTFAPAGGINPAPPSRGGTAGSYQNELLTSAWKSACAEPTKPYEGNLSTNSATPYDSNTTGPIVTTSITPDLPTFTPYYSSAQSTYPFTEYKIDSVIKTKTGVMQVPIAGKVQSQSTYVSGGGSTNSTSSSDSDADESDAPECAFLTLAKPTQQKIVDWTVERVGAPPIVPNSAPVDPNLVLIDEGHIQVAEPSLLTDGVSVAYRVSGRYVYGLKKALKKTDSLPFPAPPWENSLYGQLVLGPDSFSDGIIDFASQSSSSGNGDGGTTGTGDGGTTGTGTGTGGTTEPTES